MNYKIYLPDETQEKLLYAGTIQVQNNDIVQSLICFMKEENLGDLIISDQGRDGFSLWKDDRVYCFLKKA